jgi:predicted nucleic acid-binding Zn ribbon protein
MEHIGKALHQFLRDTGLEEGLRRQELIRAWPEVVGSEFARDSRARRIEKETLWVEAASSVCAAELTMIHEEILRRYRGRFGSIPFRRICVRVGHFATQEKAGSEGAETSRGE